MFNLMTLTSSMCGLVLSIQSAHANCKLDLHEKVLLKEKLHISCEACVRNVWTSQWSTCLQHKPSSNRTSFPAIVLCAVCVDTLYFTCSAHLCSWYSICIKLLSLLLRCTPACKRSISLQFQWKYFSIVTYQWSRGVLPHMYVRQLCSSSFSSNCRTSMRYRGGCAFEKCTYTHLREGLPCLSGSSRTGRSSFAPVGFSY